MSSPLFIYRGVLLLDLGSASQIDKPPFSFLAFDEKLFLFAEYVDPGFVFEAVIAIEISRERK